MSLEFNEGYLRSKTKIVAENSSVLEALRVYWSLTDAVCAEIRKPTQEEEGAAFLLVRNAAGTGVVVDVVEGDTELAHRLRGIVISAKNYKAASELASAVTERYGWQSVQLVITHRIDVRTSFARHYNECGYLDAAASDKVTG